MIWSHIFCVFIFPWDTVAENLCSKFMIKNIYIHNEVLTAEENTTVNISVSFENKSCVTNTFQKLTVESFDNQWKVYKKSCTFLQSKLTCSANQHYNTAQCVCGSSELYFIKSLSRADKTQWRWTSLKSNNISDSVIILFNVTYPSLLTNLTINGYSGTKLLKQNESANIVCEWQNSNPPTTTRLVKNNITLMESYDTGSITYTLSAVRCSDASAIKCETGNKDQLTVLLLVECPPEFVSSSEMQNITVGHMLRVHAPVRSHTTEIKRCEITQLIKYSSKNYSEAHILKVLNPQSLDCSTLTANDKEQCFCSLTGSPPDLVFNLYLMNVNEEYNGVWQARITNGIGSGQLSLSLQFSGADNISPNNDMISTVLGTIALVCAMSAVIISCVKVKQSKDHLLRHTSHVYEEIDTQSVLTVCRSSTPNVGSVRCASETPSAPFPIINLGSSSPDPSNDEMYSRLQMK